MAWLQTAQAAWAFEDGWPLHNSLKDLENGSRAVYLIFWFGVTAAVIRALKPKRSSLQHKIEEFDNSPDGQDPKSQTQDVQDTLVGGFQDELETQDTQKNATLKKRRRRRKGKGKKVKINKDNHEESNQSPEAVRSIQQEERTSLLEIDNEEESILPALLNGTPAIKPPQGPPPMAQTSYDHSRSKIQESRFEADQTNQHPLSALGDGFELVESRRYKKNKRSRDIQTPSRVVKADPVNVVVTKKNFHPPASILFKVKPVIPINFQPSSPKKLSQPLSLKAVVISQVDNEKPEAIKPNSTWGGWNVTPVKPVPIGNLVTANSNSEEPVIEWDSSSEKESLENVAIKEEIERGRRHVISRESSPQAEESFVTESLNTDIEDEICENEEKTINDKIVPGIGLQEMHNIAVSETSITEPAPEPTLEHRMDLEKFVRNMLNRSIINISSPPTDFIALQNTSISTTGTTASPEDPETITPFDDDNEAVIVEQISATTSVVDEEAAEKEGSMCPAIDIPLPDSDDDNASRHTEESTSGQQIAVGKKVGANPPLEEVSPTRQWRSTFDWSEEVSELAEIDNLDKSCHADTVLKMKFQTSGNDSMPRRERAISLVNLTKMEKMNGNWR